MPHSKDFAAGPIDMVTHPPPLGARIGVYYRQSAVDGLFCGFGTYVGGKVVLDNEQLIMAHEAWWASEANVQYELARAGIETFVPPDVDRIRQEKHGVEPHEEIVWS